MEELIKVMKEKQKSFIEEKKEISDYLIDDSKQITLIDVESLSKEDLQKRNPYLDQLSFCYEEIIETLRNNPDLPLESTKDFLYNIVNHYYVSYDENEEYKQDLEKFREFVSKHKQK